MGYEIQVQLEDGEVSHTLGGTVKGYLRRGRFMGIEMFVVGDVIVDRDLNFLFLLPRP